MNEATHVPAWPRAVLWLSALTFAGFGLAATFFPLAVAGMVGISLPVPDARADFRALYGGLENGVAAFLALCALRPPWIEPGLLMSGIALVGFGSARLFGALVDDPVTSVTWGALAIEVLGAALSFAAWNAVRR